jgi:hypothetical protein
MTESIREVAEGVMPQGADETVTYTITTTNWGSSPTSPSMVVKRDSDGTVVTSTIAPTGSISTSGDVLTLIPLTAMTAGERYRIEVKFTITGAGAPFECFFYVDCEV